MTPDEQIKHLTFELEFTRVLLTHAHMALEAVKQHAYDPTGLHRIANSVLLMSPDIERAKFAEAERKKEPKLPSPSVPEANQL